MNKINFYNFAEITNTTADVFFVLLFALLSIVVTLVMVYFISRFINIPKGAVLANAKTGAVSEKNVATDLSVSDTQDTVKTTAGHAKHNSFNFIGILCALLGLGLVIRLIFAFTINGYREDISIITNYISIISSKGLSSYYPSKGILLYPIIGYIYALFGGIANAFSFESSSIGMQIFVKLPFIIADIITAAILYRMAKKYINNYVALAIAGFVALFPAFIFASSVWGSIYSIVMLLVVLCFSFVATKNFPALIGVFSLLLLTTSDAVYFFPVIAIFVIYNYIKMCSSLKKSNVHGIKNVIMSSQYKNIVLIPIYVVISIVAMYLISLPFMMNVSNNFFVFFFKMYLEPLGNLTYFGFNALNIFNIFLKNGATLLSSFPTVVFSVMFGIIITAIVLLVYLSRKNRANLSYIAAYVILLLSIFFMDFEALNLIYILGLLLLAFILIKDKRILHIFSILSFVVVLNASSIMARVGYLSNEVIVGETNSLTLLSSGGALAISIICSVLTIITFIYATIILLDLSMSNKRKQFLPLESNNFFSHIKYFIV